MRFGREDDFWQMGDTGPCGPCSEVRYYMGDTGRSRKNRAEFVTPTRQHDDGIWNLVFMQFNHSEHGKGGLILTPLPAPSVDPGVGFEGLTTVLQGADPFKPI